MELDRIEQLRNAISESRGWRLRRELAGLARCYRLFLGNDHELRAYLMKHSEPPLLLELWDIRNRDGFELFLDEVDRLLHNYVAAAATLRNHTRRVWQQHGPPDEALNVEYERRVRETFASAPLPQFVQGLRNYTVHRRLPVARGTLAWTHVRGFDSGVIFVSEELRAWGGWNESARRYLDAAPERAPST